ncbi:MAG: amino acid ABC transporter permease, partial [Arenicellales bacterium]|nr:amino acid ABC transporter permease [Arenicellales bacterium]
NWNLLAIGLLGTFKIFIVTCVIGLSLGLLVGIGRYSRAWSIRLPAAVFVEFFRNTPVLIQIIWFYFALPILVPFEINAFTASVMGIALNTAAFSADIYRGGIQSIDRGQWDGGRAIGMSYLQTMRRVIIPQAIKRMLPPLTNRGIEVFKMSTLASIVAYAETIHQAKLISESYFNPIESFSVVALLFFVVLFPIVQVTYLLERRFGKSD